MNVTAAYLNRACMCNLVTNLSLILNNKLIWQKIRVCINNNKQCSLKNKYIIIIDVCISLKIGGTTKEIFLKF